jgi:hypothetical protein
MEELAFGILFLIGAWVACALHNTSRTCPACGKKIRLKRILLRGHRITLAVCDCKEN